MSQSLAEKKEERAKPNSPIGIQLGITVKNHAVIVKRNYGVLWKEVSGILKLYFPN